MHLFDALSCDQRNLLLEIGKTHIFPSRALLIRQNDPPNGIFIILSGQVESVYFSDVGRDLRLALWSRHDFVGAPHIFGTVPQRWSASAFGQVKALHLGQEDLRHLIARDPDFAETLIVCLGDKGDRYSKLAQDLAFHTVSERLAYALTSTCDLDQTQSSRRTNPLELSREIGSTRQAVGAILKAYERQGLIARQRDLISVLNVPALRKLAGLDGSEKRH
ncbi:MAG: CRP/FNR family cyclic AMP-dependent transcriptional regulator [Gammaproteobacteria bacterium]|jgi:CRP/FNR family cyclic AMP-dependent transcriptional regulator